ncbi:ABC transporter ATP-binding protein [Pseudoalteromonas sp. T1lg65]|uniref:ABC transporter ATP-binding protein n=1 Tax=Pseudoalteromonas sp. T1lg65 TaxID=2077101 RepID=UPI003F7AD4B8
MLKMQGIKKVFRTELVETHALKGVDLEIKKGEFAAITGPSGSGKSTFLNIMGLLEDFTAGEYLLDGISVKGMGDDQKSRLRNEKIGFIFQSFNLLPDLPLYDNIDVPLRYRGLDKKQRHERIMNALETVGLANRHKHLPTQLSGGQQQRVAIARAIAGDPAIILADEPTGNLDSKMAESVMQLLEKINRDGATIIMVTHDDILAKRVGRHIQISDGMLSDISENITSQPKVATA